MRSDGRLGQMSVDFKGWSKFEPFFQPQNLYEGQKPEFASNNVEMRCGSSVFQIQGHTLTRIDLGGNSRANRKLESIFFRNQLLPALGELIFV